MARKHLIFISLALCLIFLVGCSGSGSGGRQSTTSNYRTGTSGLEFQFRTNAPPATVFAEDSSFPVALEVFNRGVYPGENEQSVSAKVFFTGFDKRLITGLDNVQDVVFEPEEAKTRYNPEGGFNVLDATGTVLSSYFKDSKVDVYETKINAILCYNYKTKATIDVCVDPSPNKLNEREVCTPGTTGSSSQGAPVAITSVESVPQKGKARFVITLSNVGAGDIIRESVISSCIDTAVVKREDYDKVILEEVALGGNSLDCTPSLNEEVRMSNGKGVIVCKADIGDETLPAYRSILTVGLSYGYKKSAEKTLRILGE
jgi:hypothetical protein